MNITKLIKRTDTNKQESFHIERIIATKLIFAFSFLIMLNGCVPMPLTKLDDRVFEETQSYTVYNPEIAELHLPNNVTVEVEPVEPTYLNRITYLAATQSGDTERLSFREIRNLQSSDEVSTRDKRRIEQLITVSGLLNEEYDSTFSEDLIEEILVTHSNQLGIEIIPSSQDGYLSESEYPNSFNPYFVNERYLSTIKLTYTNNGSEVQRFRNDGLSVVFQGNTFSPHDHEYFDQRLDNSRQIDNVFNFNMPEEITVGPSQTITRYIGVQPLPNRVNEFSVQYVSGNDFVSSEFTVTRVNETIEYVFKGFIIDDRDSLPYNLRQRDRHYVLINGKEVTRVDEKQFYLQENDITKESWICGFFHRSLTTTYSSQSVLSPESNLNSIVKCLSVDLLEAPEQIVKFGFD